ncbi:MAG: RNA-directed DNA polymerase [Rhodopirellula sp.]|nr:RNA-directed DNA polymerase [Rhodopirellula sp.]
MKRAGNLFRQIAERGNLQFAYVRALRGKRDRPDAIRFGQALEHNLNRLAEELTSGRLTLGRFHQFVIHDPKERIITAPCFEERVLHHAIMNVCEPVFDRWLIADTYACRVGKGREAAVERAADFTRKSGAFLKLDARRYFDSIPHDELLQLLPRLFKDPDLYALFEQIIRAFRGGMGTGLPIGSLTSQYFANFYLGWFDRFVKEQLRVRGYVRYMDDVMLWGESPQSLRPIRDACVEFLATELKLKVREPFINRTPHGCDFLGCRLFPTHTELNRRSRRRFRQQLQKIDVEMADIEETGEGYERVVQQRAEALFAFAQAAGVSSWQFRTSELKRLR